ncbi:hypothetical protein [Candidatus Methylacidiphilum infernorum]|uniref:Uncharacterized protein n=1 Tax=Methylacidiphilum infernorum (isolate V4) TaxID=481448 RepID=B3DY16_METI4|nr:hypothetical protein [Candidatus Methylacidiphilum infernorum]ACD83968.1 Hypothetical protein Minf_1914 [Methylacidiphilum infernorum V4]
MQTKAGIYGDFPLFLSEEFETNPRGIHRILWLAHPCLNRKEAGFPLHRGRFRSRLATKTRAFPSRSRHRGTHGQILAIHWGVHLPVLLSPTGWTAPPPRQDRQAFQPVPAAGTALAAGKDRIGDHLPASDRDLLFQLPPQLLEAHLCDRPSHSRVAYHVTHRQALRRRWAKTGV